MDAQGVEQRAHQGAHPPIFNEVVEILQGKAGPQCRLIEPQLIADPLKIPGGIRFHQLPGPVDQKRHGPGGGLGVDDADLLFRVLFQHHLPGHDSGVVGAGEVGGDGKAHRPIPGFEGPGKGGGRGAGGGGGALFRRHGVQQVRYHQIVIVQKFPGAHLNAKGNGLKADGGAVPARHPQVAAAVTYNIPHHTKPLVIWF